MKKIRNLYNKIIYHYRKLVRRTQLFFVKNIIISYPKSGRTWLRFFIATYLAHKYNIPLKLNHINIFTRNKKYIDKFFFTHTDYHADSLEALEESISHELKNKRVLFLVRDPRDVVVSLFFHYTQREDLPEFREVSMSEFIRNSTSGLPRVVAFMNIILAHRSDFIDFEIIFYEDIIMNNKKYFSQALSFLGEKDLIENSLEHSLIESDFKNMKIIERENVIKDSRLRSKDSNNQNAMKVRRGKVGGYKDYFSEEDVVYAESEMKKLNKLFDYK